MTDNELRRIVLRAFYDRRKTKRWVQWTADENISDLPPLPELHRISQQLADHGLIDWKPVGRFSGLGRISSNGIDIIEGVATSALVSIDQSKTYNVSSSHNVQIGEGNVQDVKISFEKIIAAINGSTASEAEKAEAKGLLKQFLEHPIIAAIVGGLAGSLNLNE